MKKVVFALELLGLVTSGLTGASRIITLPVITQGPQKRCVEPSKPQPKLPLVRKDEHFNCYQNNNKMQQGSFVSFNDIAKITKELDGSFEKVGETWRLSLSGGSTDYWPDFYINKVPYTSAESFLSNVVNLQQNTVPLEITGYSKPILKLYNKQLTPSKTLSDYASRDFYANLGAEVVTRLYYNGYLSVGTTLTTSSGFTGGPTLLNFKDHPQSINLVRKKVFTSLPSGEVAMSIAISGKDNFMINISPVSKDGSITFYAPKDIQFVDSASKLKSYQKGQPLTVLLVRVTNTPFNNLQEGIIKASTIKAAR